GAYAVGEGEKKIGVLQAGVARLQNPTKKKFLFPPRGGGRGQEIGGKSRFSIFSSRQEIFRSSVSGGTFVTQVIFFAYSLFR
ncbi:MAG TPA: hypothetical protein PKL16_07485, partial [Anaerolineae bacterium]|nr:hypothetical protein [Anaerolineae bacterium]HQM15546.1 hypothetical protein [Anaerolineae bacterium]